MIGERLRLSTPHKVLAGFFGAAMILAVMMSGITGLSLQSADSQHLVAHTYIVLDALEGITGALHRAESEQRAYFVTGDRDYFAGRDDALSRLESRIIDLRELTADNPAQQARLARLAGLVQAKLDDLNDILATRPEARTSIGQQRVQQDAARTAAIVSAVAEMQSAERRLLAERSAVLRREAILIPAALGGVSLLFLIFLWLLFARIRREIAERRRAEQAAQDLAGQLAERGRALEATIVDLDRSSGELQAANEELRSFSYIVSHDLRAPLVNLKGFVGELRHTLKDVQALVGRFDAHLSPAERQAATLAFTEDIPESMGFLESSVTKMDGLINAVLALSRVGHRDLRLEPIDVAALVAETLKTMAFQLEQGGSEVGIGTLPPVTADRLALEQIFANLLSNAVKYLQPGRMGRITVTGERDGAVVRYRVSDNGRGIAPADRERVFELFRRVGRQDQSGEGIGLAFVRTLVRRHGGQISCHSVPGEGSVFTVTLPAEQPS